MFNMLKDIADFHQKFGQGYIGKIRELPRTYARFRHQFMVEEADEWLQAQEAINDNLDHMQNSEVIESHDKAELTHQFHLALDSVVDQLYILLGSAYAQGFTAKQIEEAWKRVHAANMNKIKADQENPSMRGYAAYDIVKPKGWTAPNLCDLVEDHTYNNL